MLFCRVGAVLSDQEGIFAMVKFYLGGERGVNKKHLSQSFTYSKRGKCLLAG